MQIGDAHADEGGRVVRVQADGLLKLVDRVVVALTEQIGAAETGAGEA